MDKKKLILPISIILGCLILGGFFYAIQANKQKSIEQQQLVKIEADKEVEKVKTELEQKKYIADRKNDCLDIYKTENDKWNNVQGWRYDEEDDGCFIKYKDPSPKSKSACEEGYPTSGEFGYLNLSAKLLCLDGDFEKSF